MSLYDLSPELIIEIAKCLDHEALARFSQTNHRMFILATPILLVNSRSWVGRYGMTILHWAAENGRTTLIEQLLERKVVDIENTEGRVWTALHYSAASGQVEAARVLLAHGANPAAHDDYRHTPMRVGGPLIPLPIEIRPYRTPLHYAASNGHDDVVRLLVESGVDINDFGRGIATPLQLATGHARHSTVKLLLDLGADMKPAPHSLTPLHMAICSGYNTVFEALLERSVDSDISFPCFGSTLLHIAVMREERHASIPALLARGADMAARDNEGRTPLHLAALGGFTRAVKLLLRSGADIAARDSLGATALHWAALNHCESVIGILLQRGADATAEDQTGKRAAEWANAEYKDLGSLARIVSLLEGKTEN